jgi:hypothetical protein
MRSHAPSRGTRLVIVAEASDRAQSPLGGIPSGAIVAALD